MKNIVTDEEILNFLIELENISIIRDLESVEGSSSDLNFSFNSSEININSSWMTYEEGGSTILKINLTTLEVTYDEQASTVYGNASNQSIKIVKKLEEVLNLL